MSNLIVPEDIRAMVTAYLNLPFRLQIAVARAMNVFISSDFLMTDEAMALKLFRLCREKGLTTELNAEIARYSESKGS